MKTKTKIILIALIMILGIMAFTNVYAAIGDKRELGANEVRPFTNSKYQFRVGSGGQDLVYTVFKIYDNKDRNEENEILYSKALYCLRGGVGFGASEETDVSVDPIEYTEIGEMHENAKSVIEKYQEYYGINLDRNVTINNKEVNIYNAILWVLDEAYLPVDKINEEGETVYSEAEYKEELLTKVGIPVSQQGDITKDDIEVIQQIAIWYFANYDEQEAGNEQSVSVKTRFPAQFISINGDNNIEFTRMENLNKLYQYLVDNAIDNNQNYIIDEETGARTKYVGKNEFDKTEALKMESVSVGTGGVYDYYKIGPITIKNDINEVTGRDLIDISSIIMLDANGNSVKRLYDIPIEDEETGEIISGGKHVVYRFVDENGEEVSELKKGNTYYIRFYKAFEKGSKVIPIIEEDEQYDMSTVTLKIGTTYTLSTARFLVRENTDQPIVEIDKEKVSEGDEITTQYFDLSLRKFITSINGQELIGENSRIPKIDLSKLNTIDDRTGALITTATYTHPKDALLVEAGNRVVYTIRIYNEGELDGTATSITDYLPEGLKLVPSEESAINDKYGWQIGESEREITTNYLQDTTIKAYDPTKTTEEDGWQKAEVGDSGLYYADVQVECEVVADITGESQSLRNIAAITEDTGDDRDSEPVKPDLDNYNPPADNSSYQQDDDDYEDLVVEGKNFDLSLRKFITKVERINEETGEPEEVEIALRVPEIEIKELKDGTSTTARYVHPKNEISLKRGDIIYYTIRVYNEGQVDGYAQIVKDYLPEGLELVEGENDIWTLEGNTLSTTSLQDQKILGYDRDLTSAPEGANWQKASDDETGLYYLDLNVVCRIKDDVQDGVTLKNVAEIAEDKSEGADLDDRDSVPDNVYEDDAHNPGIEVDGYTPGEQDDDDFEMVTVEPDQVFDLALRKFITSIRRNGEEVEFDDRTPKINTETLINGTFDRNGELEHTATYEHSKEPLLVKKGDIITYTLRIYNEGEKDGYATEITEHIPEGLALIVNHNTNFNNEWVLPQDLDSDKVMNLVGEDGFYKTAEDVKNLSVEDFSEAGITDLSQVQLITGDVAITSAGLDDELIKAFDKDRTEEEEGWQKADQGDGGLYYKDIQVSCLVIAENTYKDVITNEAEISEDKDENKEDVDDRDSVPGNLPEQEDDNDYEPVILKYFDLALRKLFSIKEVHNRSRK